MRNLFVFLALLLLTTSVEAQGRRVCVYTDADGYRVTEFCDRLRLGTPSDVYIGLPGLRFGFGRNEGWRSGNYHGGWGGGVQHYRAWEGGGSWQRPQPAPGIQFNFGTGGGHGGQGRHGQRP